MRSEFDAVFESDHVPVPDVSGQSVPVTGIQAAPAETEPHPGLCVHNRVAGGIRVRIRRIAIPGAESHTINYSFLLYTKPSESTTRPFVDAGAGIKFYRGTGTETVTQPLSQYALLTQAGDLTGVVSFGGGVKVKLGSKAWLRLDVHDYMSPFPKQVITPNFGANVNGWMHDIVPMVAISFGQ